VLAGAYLVAGGFVILLGSAVATPWLLVMAISVRASPSPGRRSG
jgi:hypothetical protein